MTELTDMLANIDTDSTYQVLEILKDCPYGRTEKVLAGNSGQPLIRKYFPWNSAKTESEYLILSTLKHPLLPKVYGHYELSGQSVMLEEYVEGEKLSDLISRSGGLPLYKSIDIILKLCMVVSYLHAHKPNPIIHRDIKPDNIIYQPNGQIKLIDFGAARSYQSGKTKDTVYIGTLGYAPPEQFGFGQTDCRADIYAIGMTMIHMLTGVVPERGNKRIPACVKILPELGVILQKSTEFDPEKRYETVAQFSEAITGLSFLKHLDRWDFTNHPEESVPNQKPQKRIYPVYCHWPNLLKAILIPFHIFLLLTFVAVTARDLFTQTGFGQTDDILQFCCDFFIFALLLFPGYALGFNLFNLNEKIRFFHRHRRIKKTVVFLIIFVTGCILITGINSLHSAAYTLAHAVNSATG